MIKLDKADIDSLPLNSYMKETIIAALENDEQVFRCYTESGDDDTLIGSYHEIIKMYSDHWDCDLDTAAGLVDVEIVVLS